MTGMTSRQRLLAAFQRRPVDRVPVIVRGVNPYARHMNWRGDPDPSYRPLIERVRQDCDVEHIWAAERGFFLNDAELRLGHRVQVEDDWRVTYSSLETPRGPLTAIAREGTDSYSHGVLKHWICDEDDLERFLSLPYLPAQPDLTPYFQASSQLGEAGYVLPNLNDPIGQVHSLIGSELLALWSKQAARLIERLLEVMHERCLDYAERLLAAGISPVLGLLGQESVVPPLLSPRHFDRFVTRYNRPLIDLAHAHGCLVSVHCHGRLDAVLERFAGMGVDILHPIEAPPMGDVTLRDAKRRVDGRICLQGNLQIGDLMLLEHDEIVAQTREALAEGMPGGGLVLTMTATPFERILSRRTLDNLMAMVDTALAWGK